MSCDNLGCVIQETGEAEGLLKNNLQELDISSMQDGEKHAH